MPGLGGGAWVTLAWFALRSRASGITVAARDTHAPLLESLRISGPKHLPVE